MRARTLVVALSLGLGLVLGLPALAQDRGRQTTPPTDLVQLERRLKELEAKVARLEREAAAAKQGVNQASGVGGFSRAAGAVGGFGSGALSGLGGTTNLGDRSGLGSSLGQSGTTGGLGLNPFGGTGRGGVGGGTGRFGRGGLGTPSDQRKPSAARDTEKMEIVIVQLKNADASETVNILQRLLLEDQQQRMRLVADPRTNSILLNAHRDDLEKVAKVISALDQTPLREREKGKGVDKP